MAIQDFIFSRVYDVVPAVGLRGLCDGIHRTLSSCGVVARGSGVTVNISNKGSSLALLCTLSNVEDFCPIPFRLMTVTISLKCRSFSLSPIGTLYSRLSIRFCIIGASVKEVSLRGSGGRTDPYS